MPTIAELIRDGKAKQSIGGSLRDFVQGASNAAAGAVSGPIDLVSMGLQGAGLPMPAAPFGGSQWMRDRGLIRDPENRTAGLLGESLGNVLPIVAAAKAPQIARGLLQAGDNLRAPTPMNTATGGQAGAIVWHGSPYKFAPEPGAPLGRFRADKIGTGEGAQAYGVGHYTADARGVAKSYRDKLAKAEVFLDNAPVTRARSSLDPESMGINALRMESSPAAASAALRNAAADDSLWIATAEADRALRPKYLAAAKWLDDNANRLKVEAGALYKIDLPDEQIAKMLNLDKPWSQQTEAVRKSLDTSALEKFYNTKDLPASQVMYHLNQGRAPADSAEYLRSLGIPGVRYLDGGSRTAGAGSSNYVVFPGNESLLNILSRE